MVSKRIEINSRGKYSMAPSMPILVLGVTLLLTVSALADDYVPFSYNGASGPDKWGSLSPSYEACSRGKSQSPIDIKKKDAVRNANLQLLRNYTATNGTLINNAFNIGVSFGNDSGLADIDGKMYTLKALHWHTPSEHTINGKRFAAELHLLHASSDGSRAVIGILFNYGKPDPLLCQLNNSLHMLTKETQASVYLNTMQLSGKSSRYYRYWGSLTVPPCTENISWTILGKVREISKEQVEALRAPLNSSFINNSRPLQPLHGRKVELFDVGLLNVSMERPIN